MFVCAGVHDLASSCTLLHAFANINTCLLQAACNTKSSHCFTESGIAAGCAFLHLQSKLMEFKVDKAIDSVGRMASAPGADSLVSTNMRRISADLVVMRNAARLTRTSMRNLNVGQQSAGGAAAAGDVEAGVRSVELEAARMHQSIAQVWLQHCKRTAACCGMSWPVGSWRRGACRSLF
jgi:hypothetical protein